MSQAVLQDTELQLIDAYWRAANYLSVVVLGAREDLIAARAARAVLRKG